MSRTLYLECNNGISGDMVVAALLDLGASEERVRNTLSSLPLDGFRVEVSRVKKSGLDCCDFHVILEENLENYDHDMDYLYGHLSDEGHVHSHGDHGHGEGHDHHGDHSHGEGYTHHHGDHNHGEGHTHHHGDHSHGEGHTHHHGDHIHRGMKEVQEIISQGEMTEGARALASRIFAIIAAAEAEAHGTTVEKVHFHEVGAVDSIVDIVAAAVCFDDLGITETIITGIGEGSGTVRCAHGILSVPVPAVAAIVREYRLPVKMTGRRGELITPTGAAIAAAVCSGSILPDPLIIERTGMGAGKRAYEIPSILRAFILSPAEKGERHTDGSDGIWKLETNLDDCTGEDLGFVMNSLFEAGARDVFYTPVYMKKNRPGVLLSVLCLEQEIARMEEIIFRETTTIGIRRYACERTVLPRRMTVVDLPGGQVEMKVCTLPDGTERAYPEYESVSRLSQTLGVSRREILAEIQKVTH